MAEEAKDTQVDAGAETIVTETTTEKTEEKTISEIINNDEKKEEAPQTVGLDKFLEVKNQKKELQKELNDLKSRLERGEDMGDIGLDLDALAEEHDIDKGFLTKLVNTIKTQAEKSLDERIDKKLAPITAKEKAEKIDKAFKTAFDGAIENMPEYKEVVNPEVIKTLSLDPKNANKTFTQLIEETYGNAITGKRTIETTKPGGGKEPTEVDFDKAAKDPEYFKEVMANPDLKKKYNAKLTDRISRHL